MKINAILNYWARHVQIIKKQQDRKNSYGNEMRGSIKSNTVIHRYDWGWLRNGYKLDKYEAIRNEAAFLQTLTFYFEFRNNFHKESPIFWLVILSLIKGQFSYV